MKTKMNAKSFLLWTLSILVLNSGNSFSATAGAGGRDRDRDRNSGSSSGSAEVEFGHHHDHSQSPKTTARCEEVTIPMCKDMPYNKTILPNLMGHVSNAKNMIKYYMYDFLKMKTMLKESLLFSFKCKKGHTRRSRI